MTKIRIETTVLAGTVPLRLLLSLLLFRELKEGESRLSFETEVGKSELEAELMLFSLE
jgi:hypothetical protein